MWALLPAAQQMSWHRYLKHSLVASISLDF